MKNTQRGGTIIGFILGLLIGLGAALAVAVYVAKVPVPFLNKAGLRSAGQDQAEAERNRNWNPNQSLSGNMPARPATPETPPTSPEPGAKADTKTDTKTDVKADAKIEPKADAKADTKADAKHGADPLGDFAKAKAGAAATTTATTTAPAAPAAGAEPYEYFVQAGAYNTQGDADAQRAKLAMLGWEAKVSENKKDGRAVFRVRVGPFAKRDDAAGLKEKLDDAGVPTNLVRVQR